MIKSLSIRSNQYLIRVFDYQWLSIDKPQLWQVTNCSSLASRQSTMPSQTLLWRMYSSIFGVHYRRGKLFLVLAKVQLCCCKDLAFFRSNTFKPFTLRTHIDVYAGPDRTNDSILSIVLHRQQNRLLSVINIFYWKKTSSLTSMSCIKS